MQVLDLFDDRTCRRKRRNVELLPDQADPMVVVPDGIDSPFIEREQGQEIPDQLFTIGIEAQRMTRKLDRVVVVTTKPEMTNHDDGRLDEKGVKPLAFFEDPFGIFAVQKRPLVPIQNRENLLHSRRFWLGLGPAERAPCGVKQRPGVNVQPRRLFKYGLGADGPQTMAVLV